MLYFELIGSISTELADYSVMHLAVISSDSAILVLQCLDSVLYFAMSVFSDFRLTRYTV